MNVDKQTAAQMKKAGVDPNPEVYTGTTQYDYVDKTAPDTKEVTTPMTARQTEATQAELNPAYYPARNKPEVLLNEAEKAGAEFPGGGQIEAALIENSEEDLDPKDPEVANPPAPGAGGQTSQMQDKVDDLAKQQKVDEKK